MAPLRYDEKELIKSLDHLPPELKTVFAAACAQRLLPAYQAFTRVSHRGDAVGLTAILDRVWSALEGAPMTARELTIQLDTCMTLIPKEDDTPWYPEQAYAEDAGAAVAYALRTLSTGKSEEAAWAGRRSYEAIDHYLANKAGIDPRASGGEEALMRHPLMQAELSRQRRDLEDLQRAAQSRDTGVPARLKTRAINDSTGFFQVMS